MYCSIQLYFIFIFTTQKTRDKYITMYALFYYDRGSLMLIQGSNIIGQRYNNNL